MRIQPFVAVAGLFLAAGSPAVAAEPQATAAAPAQASAAPVPVNYTNFVRAETDLYFGRFAREGKFGRLGHARDVTSVDDQNVVRMNRDTLYSSGVFDLDAAPVTVTLPDVGTRFMSMQIVSHDHYTIDVVYGPGRFTYTRNEIGTRYVFLLVRTLVDPESETDIAAAHAAQDAIVVEQARTGAFDAPNWDTAAQRTIRDALSAINTFGGTSVMFGRKDEVEPVSYLIGAAVGWGGNPRYAAVYDSVYPKLNDGRTVHRLTVKDVPVDGFWSISLYNAEGFFQKNPRSAYSVNNLTAKAGPDGTLTVQFGGCDDGTAANCLPIVPGWNYTVRLYRPRKAVLDGTWTFPEAIPVR